LRKSVTLVAVVMILGIAGCGLVGGKTAMLSLDTTPSSIPAGSSFTFSASIDHNNGKFLGATWTLSSNGKINCSPACGTLGVTTNNGSPGNGDSATVIYLAPSTPPNPNSVTITATSVENSKSSAFDTFTITSPPTGGPSVATTALPGGAVNVLYLTPPLSATRGTPPYSWSLQSAANTFPPGLSLNADGSITGTPTAANTFVFTVQVTDSANQTGTGNLSIQVTAAGTANAYTGVSSPGDIWQFVSNTALNQFTATNQTTGALYTGTTLSQLLPNGLTQTTITTSTDPNLPVGSTGFGVELPGVGATFSLGGATDRPVVLIPQSPCPTISAGATVQFVHLGKPDYDATMSESYATATVTQAGSVYNVTVNSYLLDGTLRTQQSGALPTGGTCSNGVITFPNVPTSDGSTTTVTVVAASNGLYLIDDGPGRGSSVGSQNFIGSTQLSAALSNGFTGYVFKRNAVAPNPITTFVGFGPGSGTSITGGTYANITTDPFANHGTDITVDLSSVNSNGFLQGTLTDAAGTHTPLVGLVTNNGGKFFVFGLTTDNSGGVSEPTQPYAVILIQH
jgi:hypothetical protein